MMTGDLNNRNEFESVDADMLRWCPVGDAFVETNWLAAFGTIVTSSFELSRAYNRTDTGRRLSADSETDYPWSGLHGLPTECSMRETKTVTDISYWKQLQWSSLQ